MLSKQDMYAQKRHLVCGKIGPGPRPCMDCRTMRVMAYRMPSDREYSQFRDQELRLMHKHYPFLKGVQ